MLKDEDFELIAMWSAQLPEEGRWTASRRRLWLDTMEHLVDWFITIEADPRDDDWTRPLLTDPQDLQPTSVPDDDRPITVESETPVGWVPVIETAIAVLTEAGRPLYINDLFPLVQAKRGYQSRLGLQGELYKETKREPARILKVAPATFGLVGRDLVRTDPSQQPRIKGINRREGPPGTRQDRWQEKNRDAGKCMRCGKDSAPYTLCEVHRAKSRKPRQPLTDTEIPDIQPAVPGERNCLRCDVAFLSPDRVRIRLCGRCRPQVASMEG